LTAKAVFFAVNFFSQHSGFKRILELKKANSKYRSHDFIYRFIDFQSKKDDTYKIPFQNPLGLGTALGACCAGGIFAQAPLAPFMQNSRLLGLREPSVRMQFERYKNHFCEFLYNFALKRNKLLGGKANGDSSPNSRIRQDPAGNWLTVLEAACCPSEPVKGVKI
jgi:hypothetical protein